MKYASFLSPTAPPPGASSSTDGLRPRPQRSRPGARPPAAVEQGLFGTVGEQFRGAPPAGGEIEFLPAITDPGKVICIGVNYRSHQEESGKTGRKPPPPSSPASPTPRWATWPAGGHACHNHPVRLRGRDRPGDRQGGLPRRPKTRWEHVAGYAATTTSPSATGSARQPVDPGQELPRHRRLRPLPRPGCRLGDVDALTLETRVNGDIRQKASLADLDFSIPRLIEHVTGFTRLAPGDVIVRAPRAGSASSWTRPGCCRRATWSRSRSPASAC